MIHDTKGQARRMPWHKPPLYLTVGSAGLTSSLEEYEIVRVLCLWLLPVCKVLVENILWCFFEIYIIFAFVFLINISDICVTRPLNHQSSTPTALISDSLNLYKNRKGKIIILKNFLEYPTPSHRYIRKAKSGTKPSSLSRHVLSQILQAHTNIELFALGF